MQRPWCGCSSVRLQEFGNGRSGVRLFSLYIQDCTPTAKRYGVNEWEKRRIVIHSPCLQPCLHCIQKQSWRSGETERACSSSVARHGTDAHPTSPHSPTRLHASFSDPCLVIFLPSSLPTIEATHCLTSPTLSHFPTPSPSPLSPQPICHRLLSAPDQAVRDGHSNTDERRAIGTGARCAATAAAGSPRLKQPDTSGRDGRA